MLIQKMRLKRGWSQQQLADVSGLSVRTVQRLEAGHTASLESLKSLAAVFEVDFNHLQEPDMQTNNYSIEEKLAFHKVRRLRRFYLHLYSFIIINLACVVLNMLTTPDRIWFIGLTFFWGMGLLVHAFTVFAFDRFFDGQWERDKVEKLLGKPL